ncbi:hypothetical protein FACS1894137_03560 [Spirochaetia bacterium]|nr:hypothetical protein FACS1894137_03560 [Spirochaetia bacterium]
METKIIRFIDTSYHDLFTLNDGEEIEIALCDGSVVRRVCRYIDEYHLWVGNDVFHIYQFAEIMEKAQQSYKPVT